MSPKSEILDGPPCDLEIPPAVNFFSQIKFTPVRDGSVEQANIFSSSMNCSQATEITKNLTREQQQMHSILDALINYTDSDDRLLSDVFYKLPSKTEYPDYYEVIKKPMDLKRVQNRLFSDQYESLKSMIADLNLVFDNACKFNEPDSQIYKDSLTLQKELLDLRNQFNENSSIPSVQVQVKLIFVNILVAISTYEDANGVCLSDLLTDFLDVAKDNGEISDAFTTLDDIRNNVERGRYRRLDRFQEDLLLWFSKIRDLTPLDSKIFNFSIELQSFYIKKRDEMCKDVIKSSALLYISSQFNDEIAEFRRLSKLNAKKNLNQENILETTKTLRKSPIITNGDNKSKIGDFKDSSLEKEPANDETEFLDSVEHDGLTYYPKDYAYVSEDDTLHIMRIEEIVRNVEEENSIIIKGIWCYKPEQTFHKANRKFFPRELFLSIDKDTVTVDRLKGKCCVMFVEDYLKRKPVHFREDDTYVCESYYLGRKRHFKTITSWPYPEELSELKTEQRKTPISANIKVISEIASGARRKNNQQGGDNEDDFIILDIVREEVLKQVFPNSENDEQQSSNIYYQQIEYHGNFYHLGDGVLVFREGKPHCEVMRINNIWKDSNGEKHFSGAVFARPKELIHEPSVMFYRNEVVALEQPDVVDTFRNVQNRCAILTLKNYETCRPTEVPECDVFVVDQKVWGRNAREVTVKNCSVYNYAVETIPKNSEMNLAFARSYRKLKQYNLSTEVIEDEIYYFKTPLTMEKDLSPQLMKIDTSLPIDHNDMDNEAHHLNEHLEHLEANQGTTTEKNSWLAAQPKLNAKSKSGYILYSAEVRKRIMHENPEAGFGEVSKLVGIEWKKLTDEHKRQYEARAQYIAEERAKADLLTPTAKILQPGQIRVHNCRWQMCDYQFDSQEGLYEHVKTSHAYQHSEGDIQYVCLWSSCLKYRKEGKPFPSLARLQRHVKEKHLPSSTKAIFPNQRSKHFFTFISSAAQQSPTNSTTTQPPTMIHPYQTITQGHFVHQPYGVAPQNAVACSIATLTSNNNNGHTQNNTHNNNNNNNSSSSSSVNSANATSVNTLMQQQQQHLQQQHQQQQQNSTFSQIATSIPSSSSTSSSNQHTLILPSGIVQVISSNGGPSTNLNGTATTPTINGYFTGTAGGTGTHYVVQQQPNGGIAYQQHGQQQQQQAIIVPYSGTTGNGQTQQVQQMVQATINGTTVLIPAGAQQYPTFVLNPSTSTASASSTQQQQQLTAQQIVVHHAVPAGSGGQQQQQQQQQQPQQVYVQYNGTSTAQILNGLPPGTSYVTTSGSNYTLAPQQSQQQLHQTHVQSAPHQAPPSLAHLPQQHPTTISLQQPQQQQSTIQQQVLQQPQIIDAGRTLVQAKPPEPVFLAPPNSIQVKRAMHSEAYVKYLESIYNSKQRTISKWDRSLLATQRNTSTTNKRTPYDWIRNGRPGNDKSDSAKQSNEDDLKILWKLRNELLEGTTEIQRKQTD